MRENIIPFCVWKWKIICNSYISFANRLHCNQYFHMILVSMVLDHFSISNKLQTFSGHQNNNW